MVKNGKKKKTSQSNKRPGRQTNRQTVQNKPSAGGSIVSGLSSVANRFLPGSGGIVTGIGKLLGFGAYTRAQAEAFLASRVPTMHSTLDRGIRVSHHEYLGEVSSATAFAVISYGINPGLSMTFPWLSTLAGSFQKWEDNGIVFYFKSTSATALNSTNTALGTIIGAVTYNPYQVTPVDKISMLGLSGAAAGKPAEDNLYPVECKLQQNLFGTKLVRQGEVVDDKAKYDAGNFHLARVGSQAAAVVGELHIVYDITLKEPKLAPNGWTAQYRFYAPTGAAPLGVSAPAKIRDSFGLIVNQTALTITIPREVMSPTSFYKMTLYYSFGSVAWAAPVMAASTNATNVVYLAGLATHYAQSPVDAETCTTAAAMKTVRPTVLGQDMVVSIAVGTLGAAATGFLYVEELDGSGLW